MKVELYSLPYSCINKWSSEIAGGVFDINSELQMWTRAADIAIRLAKKIDIRRRDQLIAWAVLNSERDMVADGSARDQVTAADSGWMARA